MSPLSRDPVKRERQLSNLRPTPYPPPPKGNVRRMVHGGQARQATLIAAGSWAEKIMAELEAEAPLRDGDGDLPVHDRQVVELLASALARLQAVMAWLGARPVVNEKGRPWPAEDVAQRLRVEVARYLDQLGMTPVSRMRLGVDLVRARDVLAEVMAEGDAQDGAGASVAGVTVDGTAAE